MTLTAQHYGINTRYFDWSTSAIHALIFALEQYFDDPDNVDDSKIPCVWILKPQMLNKIVTNAMLDEIGNNRIDISDIIQNIKELENFKKFQQAILDNKIYNVYLESNPGNKWKHLDYIYNLAYLDRLLESARYNPRLYLEQDSINPIFYFLAKVYIEGHAFDSDILKSTPLAVIHPLNSERIKMQHGVFTVFPFPTKKLYDNTDSLEYMRMEFNPYIKGTLCKLSIMKPRKIYNELRLMGVHKNWLYFEHDQISKEIEIG